MILPALCAYRVSAPSTAPSWIGLADLDDLIGAVNERRIEGGKAVLSGVEGADASAIERALMECMSRVINAWHNHNAAESVRSSGSNND